MLQGIQEQSFLDGFAVGELTGKLKHEAPVQVKQWIPLARIKEFTGVLRTSNYSLVGVSAHPSDPEQLLIVAEKIAKGKNPNGIQAFAKNKHFIYGSFAKDKHFIEGWEAGCLASLLRYRKPDLVEEWVQINNLDVIQQITEQYKYVITFMRSHPQDKRWKLLVAKAIKPLV